MSNKKTHRSLAARVLGAAAALCLTSIAWAACYQLTPTSTCGTAEQSTSTFNCGPIQNHPVWIITPAQVYSCTTSFEGSGMTSCANNSTTVYAVKTTYWCDDGQLRSSTENVAPGCWSAWFLPGAQICEN